MLNTIDENVAIEIRCPFCGKTSVVEAPMDGFIRWQSGVLIQHAFPNLSADVREQLESGICPSCWDDVFSDDDEDEDPEDYDDCDYEVGFDPYMGCYSDDC